MGLACYRLEQYQEAIGYCNQALTIEPNYILALARRGLTYIWRSSASNNYINYFQTSFITELEPLLDCWEQSVADKKILLDYEDRQ
ncbi:tetratricopeptide repeat protein [Aulosira sp. FACHB-113]|uniref:tetratricopeptide repeat protein n=1 Tax=Tolypothrix tenuis TaxID=457083 RepID=UPI000BBC9591|nr:tetratricopeptide repeat protein [Aulosira sp. FACHB-113]